MSNTTETTNTTANNNNNTKLINKTQNVSMTQIQIEDKLKTEFSGFSDSNITILAHYLYKYPTKWRFDDINFKSDVNKLLSEAFTHNTRPSNLLFGAIIAICIIMLCGVLWWIVMLVINRNNKNLLNDPSVINSKFI